MTDVNVNILEFTYMPRRCERKVGGGDVKEVNRRVDANIANVKFGAMT